MSIVLTPEVQADFVSGETTLEPGQWIRCTQDDPHRSRFVCVIPSGVIWAVYHPHEDHAPQETI